MIPTGVAALFWFVGLRGWSRRLREVDAPDAVATWLAPVAVVVPYLVGHAGISGSVLGLSDETNGIVAQAAIGALALALIERRLPAPVRFLLRLALSGAVAWLVASPIAEPQEWSAGTIALWVAGLTFAMVVAWCAIDAVVEHDTGATFGATWLVLGSAGSAAIVFAGLSSTGQALGALTATIGVAMVACWLWPAPGRLRAAAVPLGVLYVAHLGIGRLHADMAPLAFVILCAAPLALVVARAGAVQRMGAIAALVVRVVAIAIPVAAGAGIAATAYFGASPSIVAPDAAPPKAGDPAPAKDDDYGY